MRVAFCTLGCKVNQYDTDAMRALFEKAGPPAAPRPGGSCSMMTMFLPSWKVAAQNLP